MGEVFTSSFVDRARDVLRDQESESNKARNNKIKDLWIETHFLFENLEPKTRWLDEEPAPGDEAWNAEPRWKVCKDLLGETRTFKDDLEAAVLQAVDAIKKELQTEGKKKSKCADGAQHKLEIKDF